MTYRDAIVSVAEIANPVLKRLSRLPGTWSTTGKHPQLPNTMLHSRPFYDWHLGEALLLILGEMAESEVPAGLALIGSADGEEAGYIIYFNECGPSRHMSVLAGDGFVQ